MARVAALIPDLLFGSKVQGALRAAGHDVALVTAAEAVGDVDVLVVDLTADGVDPGELVQTLAGGEVRTLGFFAHVQPEVRERALEAGFDQVVPRSRMAREGPELVAALTRTA
jgi:CheY-like chemotaxis protein